MPGPVKDQKLTLTLRKDDLNFFKALLATKVNINQPNDSNRTTPTHSCDKDECAAAESTSAGDIGILGSTKAKNQFTPTKCAKKESKLAHCWYFEALRHTPISVCATKTGRLLPQNIQHREVP